MRKYFEQFVSLRCDEGEQDLISMPVLLSMQVAETVVVGLLSLLPPSPQVVHASFRDPNGVLERREEKLQTHRQYLTCSFIIRLHRLVLTSQHAFAA